MNLEKLRMAEAAFMNRYPGGFAHIDMQAIGKRHKVDRMIEFAQESFAKKNFRDTQSIIDNMIKVVSRSSMVSIFEKPKFKNFANDLTPKEKNALVAGLKDQLHGNQKKGFEKIVDLLRIQKLAKWPLISICPVYFSPHDEVFVKPTTAKGVIAYFELENLQYRPQPSWEFYEFYRATINEMKTKVDPSLSPSSAAFSGFLMMSVNNPL
tara:strand:- start:922 stop:1548 length:627 start_codon:yes stop_codon:yes gene_type:complete